MAVINSSKRTEAGIIPNDWEVKPLVDLFTISGGLSASRDQLSTEGFCYLHYGDIHLSKKQFIDVAKEYSEIPKLNISLTKVPNKSLLNDGDVVFVDASEDDEGASKHIVIRNSQKIPFISGLHTIVCKSKNDLLASLFKEYCFQTQNIKKQFLYYAVGTKVTGISKTNIAKILIPYPPTQKEQTAIATALSDIDSLIEKLEKLIEKKKNIKQGAMQELLTGKKRLPGFKGVWRKSNLGLIADIKTGARNNQDKKEDSAYPFFVRSPNIERINSYSYDCEAILIPGEGNIGNIFHYIQGRFDVHQRVYAITNFSQDVSGKYIFYYLVKYFGCHAMKNTVKATVDSLRLPTFKNFEINIPHQKEEQIAIVNILSDIDAEIEKYETQLAKYQDIQQGMMQVLLTGKIRLV